MTHSMDEAAAIDALSTVDLPEEDFPLERKGITLRLRALSHFEALEMQEFAKKPDVTNDMYEQKMLAKALVWPRMSTGQIKAWQRASAASEIDAVMRVVVRLSGLGEEAAKAAYKSVSDESDAGE